MRRLRGLREAEHAGYVLEDLTRIWEPRFCAAEPGTARLFAAEVGNFRRMHRVNAAELEALGGRYNIPLAVCYDQVLVAGAVNLLVSGSSSSALVPELRGDSLVSGSSSLVLVPELRGHSLISGSSSSALVPGLIGDSLLFRFEFFGFDA